MNQKTIGFKLIFIILYVVFIVSLAEAGTRLFLCFTNRYDVEMTRYALELKNLVDSSEIGFLHRPLKTTRLMNVEIATNSLGLRNEELTPVPVPGTQRILFLGDSITLGWGVEQDQTFATRLQNLLAKNFRVEVINAGHGNFNTSQEVAFYRKIGQTLGAKHVVLFYFINDAEEAQKNSKWSYLGHSRFLTVLWSAFRSWNSKEEYTSYYKKLYLSEQSGWQATQKSLILLAELCRQNKASLQVILLPELHRFDPYPFVSEHKQIKDFLDSQKISTLDLAEYFSDVQQPQTLWVAKDDAHPNATGHSMIAHFSYEFIKAGLK